MRVVTTFILIVLIVILSILGYAYFNNIALVKRESNIFTKESVKVYEENKHPIFIIDKIVLYSSAYAIDNSEDEVLQDLDLYQYTDIAIYLNNKNYINQLTEENTINELYIENIKLEARNDVENKALNYKNIKYFGNFRNLNHAEDRIKFDVVHSNNVNDDQDYDIPSFYTDCSNPITLGYVNKRFLTNCKVAGSGGVTFDGTILRQANVDLEHLECTISFTIRIKNNFGEEYICDVIIENDLESDDEGIYSGDVMKIFDSSNISYDFFKLPK